MLDALLANDRMPLLKASPESGEAVAHHLRDGEGPPGNSAELDVLKRMIIERSEGNPFLSRK